MFCIWNLTHLLHKNSCQALNPLETGYLQVSKGAPASSCRLWHPCFIRNLHPNEKTGISRKAQRRSQRILPEAWLYSVLWRLDVSWRLGFGVSEILNIGVLTSSLEDLRKRSRESFAVLMSTRQPLEIWPTTSDCGVRCWAGMTYQSSRVQAKAKEVARAAVGDSQAILHKRNSFERQCLLRCSDESRA